MNPSDIQSKLSSSRTEGGTKVSRESVPGSASTIWYAQRDALRPGPAEEIAGGWSETARSRVAEFLERIETKTLTVGVVGLGYVGLPIVREFNERGFPVIGFDVDSTKIEKLKAGEAYLRHIGEDLPRKLAASENFRPTDDPVLLREADAILLCVPTPLGKHREPDLSYVRSSTEMVAKILRPGQLIILESTTYPQTTRETIPPILETTGLTSGEDFFVAYSPEREDPGRSDHSTHTIPKLVGGLDSASTLIASTLYRAVIEKVHTVSSAEVAESAKLLENIYRAVNIALVNELKVVLSDMDIDIWEVIEAAATKPFGFQAFYPGPGLGGHCIPIDPYYLTWKAKEYGHSTRFIELAGEINTQMPSYVVESTAKALNEAGLALNGARILIVGVAYKPNVDDVRESPAAEIIERLQALGAEVSYHDPLVPHFPKMRRHQIDLDSVELDTATLRAQDATLVITHHDGIDWQLVADNSAMIVDSRNVMTNYSPAGRLIKA